MEGEVGKTKDLSLEEVLKGWSKGARRCFDSLHAAVRIEGTQWSGIVSPLGRRPVPSLHVGRKSLCQVHPDGDRVIVQLIRGEALREAVRRDRKLSTAVKRAFERPGKIRFLAELPVEGAVDAREASAVLALKVACLAPILGTQPAVDSRRGRRSSTRGAHA
jgi:hypothetical protein